VHLWLTRSDHSGTVRSPSHCSHRGKYRVFSRACVVSSFTADPPYYRRDAGPRVRLCVKRCLFLLPISVVRSTCTGRNFCCLPVRLNSVLCAVVSVCRLRFEVPGFLEPQASIARQDHDRRASIAGFRALAHRTSRFLTDVIARCRELSPSLRLRYSASSRTQLASRRLRRKFTYVNCLMRFVYGNDAAAG
jgi:hypothetical protein